MGQAELSGSIVFGPSAGGSGAFPSSTDTIQLETNPSPKQFNAATGTLSRQLNSPSAYLTLTGVGTTDTVQQCGLLYFRCDSGIKLRLTFTDPAGGADIVSEIPVAGTLVLEPPSNGPIKLLEAKGSARIEYGASGLI